MDLIVVSTLGCVLHNIAPFLIRFISSRVLAQKKHDIELRKELSTLKEDMAGLSIVDEFAKYAKLQRQYTHVESILKDNVNERLTRRLKLQMLLIYSFRALSVLSSRIIPLYRRAAYVFASLQRRCKMYSSLTQSNVSTTNHTQRSPYSTYVDVKRYKTSDMRKSTKRKRHIC
ncbi:guided entry of tail-anchored proteins factor 1 isoform X1 [Temnothorax americanus]|uniref:guided entry of tail-anchored proteins factor 1 isoform X1 n=1 Tax=Temnothorax americanus TaxID=1964332 RepID=UPI00406892EA